MSSPKLDPERFDVPRRPGLIYEYAPEEPNPEHRSCYDCWYLGHAISWWCGNQAVSEWRGTLIPGGRGCPGWKPAIVRPESRMPSWLMPALIPAILIVVTVIALVRCSQ